MTGAARTGFRRDLTAHVAYLGPGLPQIVSRIQNLPMLGMTSEAKRRIGPGGAQQLLVLRVLMDVMTGRARNGRFRISDCGLRIGLAYVRRFHGRAGFARTVAGLAKTTGNLFTSERWPDTGSLLRTVDRMTIKTKRRGDEAQILGPFIGAWIMYGTFDPQLVLVAVRAEVVAERAKERPRPSLEGLLRIRAARRGGLCPSVRVVATITRHFRSGAHRICRICSPDWVVGLRRREQGMMRSLGLFDPTLVVAGTAEIGGGTGR